MLYGGGRAKQTTIDHILSLEAVIRKAQAHRGQVVSVFFDMKKAYELTWKQGILMELNEAGIEGRMFHSLKTLSNPGVLNSKSTLQRFKQKAYLNGKR